MAKKKALTPKPAAPAEVPTPDFAHVIDLGRPVGGLEKKFLGTFVKVALVRDRLRVDGGKRFEAAMRAFIDAVEGGGTTPRGLRHLWPGE